MSCTTARRLEFWADPDSDLWELSARYLGEEGNDAASRNVAEVTFHEDYRSCGEMPVTDREAESRGGVKPMTMGGSKTGSLRLTSCFCRLLIIFYVAVERTQHMPGRTPITELHSSPVYSPVTPSQCH